MAVCAHLPSLRWHRHIDAGHGVADERHSARRHDPERKLRRTRRSGLSALVSTITMLCQVPSCMSPSNTGIMSDGEMKTGRT